MQAKLEAASQAGLDGVEIFWVGDSHHGPWTRIMLGLRRASPQECFEDFARSLHVPGSGASGGDEARYKYAAKEVNASTFRHVDYWI